MNQKAQRILQLLDGFPVTPELMEWISAASQKELDELLRFTYDFIGERNTDKLPEPQGI